MALSLEHARIALSRADHRIKIATNEARGAERAASEAWNEVAVLRAGADALCEQIAFDERVIASLNKGRQGSIEVDVEGAINAVEEETGCPRSFIEPAVKAHVALVQAGYDPDMSTAENASHSAALVAGAHHSIASIIAGSVVRHSRPMPVAA